MVDRIEATQSRTATTTSAGTHTWTLLLEGALRDIRREIAFAEDEISRFERHRQIELDPNFWCLDDQTVILLKNGSVDDLLTEIDRQENLIKESKTTLSKASKMTRYMYSNQAIFRSSIDAFTKLIRMQSENEPEMNIMAETISSQLLQLEKTTNKSVELEMKLAAMNEQIHSLQMTMKDISQPHDLANVQPRLEAVELQNCMMNELLNSIIADCQETSHGMTVLECGQPGDVRRLIRDSLDLNFRVVDMCFPNLSKGKPSVSKYLWVPHDATVKDNFFEDLEAKLMIGEQLDKNPMQRIKFLKKSVKDLEYHHHKILEVKKKLKHADQQKKKNLAAILRFLTPKAADSEISKETIQPIAESIEE